MTDTILPISPEENVVIYYYYDDNGDRFKQSFYIFILKLNIMVFYSMTEESLGFVLNFKYRAESMLINNKIIFNYYNGFNPNPFSVRLDLNGFEPLIISHDNAREIITSF